MIPRVRVQEAPFDLAAESADLTAGRADVGGVASFVGVCRADDGLAALVLEHYPGMTERALSDIAAEACARWPLSGCTVIHRVGRLLPGEPIVLVLTASAHRAAALEILQRLQEDVTMLQRAIRWGNGDQLFDLFTRTRTIRRSIIDQGQDDARPDFGRAHD